ncbi:MAG TPA: branched-chain amino acid ABC transporter substrate-binding protein [Candidatus Dormibacteraeota bacterium]|nr:branched-chain amino acid ABC transporter substrate-binding protein [Candidatus Dormibacteraeota bacterium]
MRSIPLVALASVVLVTGCSSVLSGPSSEAGPQIEIASEFPLFYGTPVFPGLERGVDMAFAQHPSVEGYRLVHVTLDDSLGGRVSIDRALQNARRAVHESAILGVIGPQMSSQAQLLIPMASSVNLTVLSPSNTLDCLTRAAAPCLASPRAQDAPTNYFRVAARDMLAARAAADFAFHSLGITQFAVLTNPIDGPFAQPMAQAFATEVVQLGGKVVYRQDFTSLAAAPDFAPMLRDAHAAGAQAIYMSAADPPSCALRRDMNGIFPVDAYLIVGDRLGACIDDASLVGRTDDHFVMTLATGRSRTIPPALKVLDGYTAAAYDCANILIDAVRRAIRANGGKIPTREQVREAVAETTSFKGITGTYSFDANGDVVNPGFSFYTLQKGNWAFWRSP